MMMMMAGGVGGLFHAYNNLSVDHDPIPLAEPNTPKKTQGWGQRQTKHKNDQNIAWGGGGLGWLRAGRSPQKQRQKGSTFVGSTVGPSLVAHGPLSGVAPRMGRLLSPTSKAALNPC